MLGSWDSTSRIQFTGRVGWTNLDSYFELIDVKPDASGTRLVGFGQVGCKWWAVGWLVFSFPARQKILPGRRRRSPDTTQPSWCLVTQLVHSADLSLSVFRFLHATPHFFVRAACWESHPDQLLSRSESREVNFFSGIVVLVSDKNGHSSHVTLFFSLHEGGN